MFVSEIYAIEDCIKYYSNTYSSSSIVNYTLPTNYKIEFTIFSDSSTSTASGRGNTAFIRFDKSDGTYVGKGATSNRNISMNTLALPNTIPVSVDTTYSFSKENGALALSDGTDTVTSSTSSSYAKIYSLNGSSNGKLKTIKVKPL